MENSRFKELTEDEIRRLEQYAIDNPNATRRDFAKVVGMSYNTFLRCLAENNKELSLRLVDTTPNRETAIAA